MSDRKKEGRERGREGRREEGVRGSEGPIEMKGREGREGSRI